MGGRNRHPIKEIEEAIRFAEEAGWSCVGCSGHAWGKILCPWNDTDCRCGTFCQKSIWSTPRVPEDLAAQIRRSVDGCVRHIEEKRKELEDRPKLIAQDEEKFTKSVERRGR